MGRCGEMDCCYSLICSRLTTDLSQTLLDIFSKTQFAFRGKWAGLEFFHWFYLVTFLCLFVLLCQATSIKHSARNLKGSQIVFDSGLACIGEEIWQRCAFIKLSGTLLKDIRLVSDSLVIFVLRNCRHISGLCDTGLLVLNCKAILYSINICILDKMLTLSLN